MNRSDLALLLLAKSPDAAELGRVAATVADALPTASADAFEVTYAFDRDRFLFAASLLATWLRGHVAAVPDSAERHSVGHVLQRPQNAHFLHETGVGRGTDVSDLVRAGTPPSATPADLAAQSKDQDGPALLRFPSESPEANGAWSADELLAEIDRAADAWSGAEAGTRAGASDAPVACSLRPTMWSAVLHGLLVPLRLGLPIQRRLTATIAEQAEWMQEHRPTRAVLSAHHARHLAMPDSVRAVACSDGVVRAAADSAARGELVALEDALVASDGVDDASILQTTPERVLVAILCAAPASTDVPPAAQQRIAESGLSADVRCVPSLPRDESGIVAPGDLYLRFGLGRDGAALDHDLAFRDTTRDDDPATRRRFELRIPERYAHFEGHFDGHPILAGAVQLDRIVLPCLRAAWPEPVEVTALARVKFIHRVDPDDTVELVLDRPSDDRCTFAIERDGVVCTGGGLRLAPQGASATP